MPVRFVDSVRLAESLGASVFVEVGPGAALTAAVDQSLSTGASVDGRRSPEMESLLTAVGQLFTAGVGVDWAAVFAGVQAQSG